MQWVALLISSAVFVGFVAAILFAFERESTPGAMRLLSAAGLATFAMFVWQLLTNPAPLWAVVMGASIHTGSGALFILAIQPAARVKLPIAFSSAAPEALLARGPYRVVRHPLYASYSLFWIGCALGTLATVVLIPAVFLICTYVTLARAEERRLLSGPLGSAYENYRKTAGLFWPKWPIKRASM